MTQAVSPPSIYTGKVNLWVEDDVVRQYLIECWSADPDFRFLIAGGNETVRGAVKDAERHGHGNVYGFSDRDFSQSNRDRWLPPKSGPRVFIPQTHEVENYFLDPVALHGCDANTSKRTVPEIEARLLKRAGELCWWMACRSVISAIRADVVGEFIGHPKCPAVTDQASAEAAVTSTPWFASVGSSTTKWLASGEVRRALQAAHIRMQAAIQSGAWKQEFSGKELFHDVRDWLYTSPPAGASKAAKDSDVARMIAQWQVASNAVPREVTDLRLALRLHVGI